MYPLLFWQLICFSELCLGLNFSQFLQNLFTANFTDHTLHRIIFGHQREKMDLSKNMQYESHIAYFHLSLLHICFKGRIDFFFCLGRQKRKLVSYSITGLELSNLSKLLKTERKKHKAQNSNR